MLRTYMQLALDAPDVALQLPIGSGKTLVGLLLAEWRRRRGGERVVYLCPTRQLVSQVAEEATTKYGPLVEPFTGPKSGFAPAARAAYEDAGKVAVATYGALFNAEGFSKEFGKTLGVAAADGLTAIGLVSAFGDIRAALDAVGRFIMAHLSF